MLHSTTAKEIKIMETQYNLQITYILLEYYLNKFGSRLRLFYTTFNKLQPTLKSDSHKTLAIKTTAMQYYI